MKKDGIEKLAQALYESAEWSYACPNWEVMVEGRKDGYRRMAVFVTEQRSEARSLRRLAERVQFRWPCLTKREARRIGKTLAAAGVPPSDV